jgi:hypothetical protein
VTANNNVLDAESGHGELDGRRFVPFARTVRRDDVARVAKD